MKLFKLIKNIVLGIPFSLLFYPFSRFFLFVAHLNKLIVWIYKNKKTLEYSDYFTLSREHSRRYKVYEFIKNKYNLAQQDFIYLEFGVFGGSSFEWWLSHNKNKQSVFYGFDTFEGLPESWGGFYDKGDMQANVPQIKDSRGAFVKGLFQDTLIPFIDKNRNTLAEKPLRIIHLDADLYSSTLFTLHQLLPFLRKGDLILFDEFNVPMHEFKAYLEFTESSYTKLKPIAAVNNFYQIAFVVE